MVVAMIAQNPELGAWEPLRALELLGASGGSHAGPCGALSITDLCLQDLPESRPQLYIRPPEGH